MRISDWSSDVCASDLIAGTLLSLALQDYPGDLEVLVLDDGSTDGIAAAARAAILEFSPAMQARFHVVDLHVNAGKAKALNLGLERPEERRVGTECVMTCRYRGEPYH